jgi:hypothetical protein
VSREEDIKGLLGRAFGPEPPLAIDRAEVFRRGRRRVRNRWLAASGGVAASVVTVVVGATMITGLAGRGADRVAAPAYTTATERSTMSGAPPGPSLPLTRTSLGAGEEPTTEAHAAALTRALAGATMISAQFTVVAVVDDGRAPLEFRRSGGGYHLAADLRDAKGVGSIDLSINHSGPEWKLPSCADVTLAQAVCDVTQESDVRMRISTERQSSGYLSNAVYALRPDGTIVYVTSTNMAVRDFTGKPTSRPVPPLDAKVLRVIATLPGLSFY